MDKLLIFGVNGFTGRHMQTYLADRRGRGAFQVVGVDQRVEKISDIEYVEADLTNYAALQDILTSVKPDYVINLVGTYQREVPFKALVEINALISKNIFDIVLSEKINLKKALVIGTAAEYGCEDALPIKEVRSSIPLSDYGLSKSIQTSISLYYHSNFNLNINIARPFNIIGKNISEDLSIGSFVKQIKKTKNGGTIYVGNLTSKRDYLDISDVIHAYFCILKKGVNGQIYNVCSGRSYGMEDVLSRLIASTQKDIRIEKKDAYFKQRDISDIYGDNTRLRRDTGWEQQVDIKRSLAWAVMD